MIMARNIIISPRSFRTCNPVIEMNVYFAKWNSMPDYVSQESALNMIYLGSNALGFTSPELLVKCATLNDFYSTRIFKIYNVVQHYLTVANLSGRLLSGDVTLVDDLRNIPGFRDCYSFATKFCSHHNPTAFSIYDTLAVNALYQFQKRDKFFNFTKTSLSNYGIYTKVIDEFRNHYGLNNYSYKDMDKYLWLIGRELRDGLITLP